MIPDGRPLGDAWEAPELEQDEQLTPPPALRVTRDAEPPDFSGRTWEQTGRAFQRLAQDFSLCPRLPWDSLHDVVGHGILPDHFWAIAASSGHGKTTTLMNLLTGFLHAGISVYMLPLEQPTDVMRIYWAALELGYPTRLALKNAWKQLPPRALDEVKDHLHWQRGPGADVVHFSDVPFVDEAGLVRAMEEAAAFGADVVLIDHLHRLKLRGHDRYAAWEAICQRLKELPKQFRIPILGSAQINERKQKSDRLRPFLPPSVDDIQGGKILEQEADVVMACYRPLIPALTQQEAKSVRMGASVKPFLRPQTIGFAVLKSRIEGVIGDLVMLDYHNGRITCAETEARVRRERED